MLKKTMLALTASLMFIAPAMAQDASLGWDVSGQQGTARPSGGGSIGGVSQGVSGQHIGGGVSMQTATQNPGSIPGPVSFGTPIPGTYIDPGSLALQTQHSGVSLPKTTLDSFVFQSGYNDMIYGDEGTDGPPPYSEFLTIGAGGLSGGLTTGHQSGLPSAWY